MFDIGFLEMMLVAIIGLLVLGPERLPEAAIKTGRIIGQVKRKVAQFTAEIDNEVKSKDIQEKLKQSRYEVGVDQLKILGESIAHDESLNDTKGSAKSAD